MTLNKYLDIAPEVQKALDEGRPVVALESTIISHGMPYPQNVETALNVEKIIRENGADPATIAVIGGRLKAGLSESEIDYLGKTGAAVTKASRRDLPILVAEGRDGATTVTTTMIIAHMAGIQVFATGGIGGVHRGAQQTFDISADLEELAHTPVMVVCAGAKSILDLGLTLEYLETHGVPRHIGYGTEELPAFYTRKSGIAQGGLPHRQPRRAGQGLTALNVEKIIRENGAVPATIAVIGGRLKAGLSEAEIDYLGKTGTAVAKASRRDLPVLVAEGKDGATTVTTTMIIAHMAGIQVFATGGIGGVHRGAQQTFDISADLEELAHTPVMVVCAGARSILDLGLTLEYLETHGVPVIGYGTEELPAFYTRKSGFKVDYRIDTPAELAKAFYVKQDMGLGGGMLVTNPIPEEYSMDHEVINKAIDEAVAEANRLGIHGKETTPFLLAKIKDITGGDSLASNIQLVYNNARLAAKTACELVALAKN